MDSSGPSGRNRGGASGTASGAERYFAAPKDSEDIDGGQLRDFLPAGLRTGAKQAPSQLLDRASYGGPSLMPGGRGLPVADEYGLGGASGGASAPGPSAQAGTAATTMSIMSPIFHFTSHDTAIVAMEHNNHCKLLALSTSKNEVFVTLTQLMPVVEDAAAVMEQNGPTLDERLQDWDPAENSVLVDRLPYPCTQLRWAPWQHGVYLAGICPGKEVRLYRYSHGRWALDAALTEPADCLTFTFSAQFTLACACRQGRIVLFTRRAVVGEEKPWIVCHQYIPSPGAGEVAGARGGGGSGPSTKQAQQQQQHVGTRQAAGRRSEGSASSGVPGDCLAADFDESGSLLAVVDHNACVRVYGLSHEGTRINHVAYIKEGISGRRSGSGGFRQVAWSPSAGRSFLILAVVFPNRIHLWFFRRPRQLNAAGMPMNAGSATGGVGGSGAQQQAPVQLQLLAESTALCEEVAKLSWNTTGTRFVTSHSDSSVHVWALDVTYQQAQPAPLAMLLQGGAGIGDTTWSGRRVVSVPSDMGGGTSGSTTGATGAGNGPGSGTGGGGGNTGNMGGRVGSGSGAVASAASSGSARPDQKLNLVVAIRKVSSVYPYHALNAK